MQNPIQMLNSARKIMGGVSSDVDVGEVFSTILRRVAEGESATDVLASLGLPTDQPELVSGVEDLAKALGPIATEGGGIFKNGALEVIASRVFESS